MTEYLAIAAYRCFVSGAATDSIDIQVRWFVAEDEEAVRSVLLAEPAHRYENGEQEPVTWQLVQIFAVDKFRAGTSGDEVTGFIASAQELAGLTLPVDSPDSKPAIGH
jgi:hypothetical protein